MPIFRFNIEGDVTPGASPDSDEQHENQSRQRISVLKNEIQVKRRELGQITSDIRTSRRGAGEDEQLEHVMRAKKGNSRRYSR